MRRLALCLVAFALVLVACHPGSDPRPQNADENEVRASESFYASWRAQYPNGNDAWTYAKANVNGSCAQPDTRHVVDCIVEKWGLNRDLTLRQGQWESGMDMDAVGDGGESYGLFQIKDDNDCCNNFWGIWPYNATSTATNGDLLGLQMSAVFHGFHPWLNPGAGCAAGSWDEALDSWWSGGCSDVAYSSNVRNTPLPW